MVTETQPKAATRTRASDELAVPGFVVGSAVTRGRRAMARGRRLPGLSMLFVGAARGLASTAAPRVPALPWSAGLSPSQIWGWAARGDRGVVSAAGPASLPAHDAVRASLDPVTVAASPLPHRRRAARCGSGSGVGGPRAARGRSPPSIPRAAERPRPRGRGPRAGARPQHARGSAPRSHRFVERSPGWHRAEHGAPHSRRLEPWLRRRRGATHQRPRRGQGWPAGGGERSAGVALGRAAQRAAVGSRDVDRGLRRPPGRGRAQPRSGVGAREPEGCSREGRGCERRGREGRGREGRGRRAPEPDPSRSAARARGTSAVGSTRDRAPGRRSADRARISLGGERKLT